MGGSVQRIKEWINSQKGFTLIELMAVLAILALILMIAVPAGGAMIEKAKTSADESSISLMENAGEKAHVDGLVFDTDVVNDAGTPEGESYKIPTLIEKGYLKLDSDSKFNKPENYVKKKNSGGEFIYKGTGASGVGSGEPAAPPRLIGFKMVGVGLYHSVALKEDGSLVSWGSETAPVTPISTTPTGKDFVAVDAGGYHSTGIKKDGSLVSWGDDSYGQVTATPTGTDFTAVSTGGSKWTVALKQDGSLVTWGWDNYYEVSKKPLGNDFAMVHAGYQHGVAVRKDGSLASWGRNTDPLAGRTAPASNQVVNTPTGTGFIAAAAGHSHSIALKADGSLVVWGNHLPALTPTGNDFVAVAAGMSHNTALKADGSLVSWGTKAGSNYYIQVSSTPKGNDFVAVEASLNVTSAIKKDGSIVSWGQDGNGQVSKTPVPAY